MIHKDKPITNDSLYKNVALSKSTFYYKADSTRKRGVKASSYTFTQSGEKVSNDKVIEDIKEIIGREFILYGYQKVTFVLRKEKGYIINAKKVYRLMEENRLLLGKVIRVQGKRNFVQYRKIAAQYPMEYLCMDIKYLFIQGEKRNYYLLSVIDVYSRKIIAWKLQSSIKQADVIMLIESIKKEYSSNNFIIRNDNGPQFIAHKVRNYLSSQEVKQEFTHIATPEENSYIESYHSSLQREIIDHTEFSSYYEAKTILTKYINFYNNERIHRGIGMLSPQEKWQQWQTNYLPKKNYFFPYCINPLNHSTISKPLS